MNCMQFSSRHKVNFSSYAPKSFIPVADAHNDIAIHASC